MKHHLYSTAKGYIGKAVEKIDRVSPESVRIFFDDGDTTLLSVEGDCCSHSIFYEIVFPEECKGSPISELLEMADGDSEEVALKKVSDGGFDFYPEENSVWDVVFKTQAGEIRIRHINSSNGYYNGYTTYLNE